MQTEGHTDMRKLKVTFRNFAKSYFRIKNAENVRKAKPFSRVRVIAAILATIIIKRLMVTLVTKITKANT
jgi:hypothetical protein